MIVQRWQIVSYAWVSLLISTAPAGAQQAADPRNVLMDQVRNDRPTFMVRVDVDHADRVYRGGEEMLVRVVSEKAGYLYLIYCDAGNSITCLFPNRLDENNAIPACQPVQVPAPGSPFRLRIGPPFGNELLKAVVSLAPVERDNLKGLFEEPTAASRLRGVKGVYVEMEKEPASWAEHHVATVTVDATGAPPDVPAAPAAAGTPPLAATSGAPRRIGVFVGISQYKDQQIRPLKTAHCDAQALADAMRRTARLDEALVLVNDQATLANIEQIVRRVLPAKTRPGDTVFLFWSGHGGRCAAENPSEKDGYDEYLVPHDGQLADGATIRRTMLVDDAFGRWLQELDGRKIVAIIDTCYAGGQSSEAKSLGKGLDAPPSAGRPAFDFFIRKLQRAKDLGQRDLAMLASCRADQISFERRQRDLGVMNYFLIQELTQAKGPLTLAQAYERLKPQVEAYVQREFPGTTQTPLLVDHLTPPFFLRP